VHKLYIVAIVSKKKQKNYLMNIGVFQNNPLFYYMVKEGLGGKIIALPLLQLITLYRNEFHKEILGKYPLILT